jgi:phage I-like protein
LKLNLMLAGASIPGPRARDHPDSMNTITTHSALPDCAEGSVPEWLHLAPMGVVHGVDGRGPYRIESAAHVAQIIAASKANKLIPVDVNHSTQVKGPKGEEAPARGWLVDFEARADGIYGRVEWTPTGTAMMTAKEYRGISPVWKVDPANGRVLAIVGAALTNTPNLTQLHTFSQDIDDMDLAPLRAKLGLAEGADLPAILAAIDAKDAVIATHSQATTEVKGMASQIVTLQTQLSTMEQAGKKATATAVIDAAIAAGKPVVSLRDHFITRHMADPAAVETEFAAMPSINGSGVVVTHAQKPGNPSSDDVDELDDDDKAVIAKMNLDPVAFAKQKAAAKKKGKS